MGHLSDPLGVSWFDRSLQTINLTFSSGPATLAGTLVTVDQTGPGRAALLLSGSGPIDRDSNKKKLPIGVMGQVADHLASEGLASFRLDKRGVGASRALRQRR